MCPWFDSSRYFDCNNPIFGAPLFTSVTWFFRAIERLKTFSVIFSAPVVSYSTRTKPVRGNESLSIYQYSSMALRLSGQNCKLLLSLNSQKSLGYNKRKQHQTWEFVLKSSEPFSQWNIDISRMAHCFNHWTD